MTVRQEVKRAILAEMAAEAEVEMLRSLHHGAPHSASDPLGSITISSLVAYIVLAVITLNKYKRYLLTRFIRDETKKNFSKGKFFAA